MQTEKTENGHMAVDASELIKGTCDLLSHLAILASVIRQTKDCPPDHTAALILDDAAMEGMKALFRASARVQAALHECAEASHGMKSSHGLESMVTVGMG